MRRLGEFSTFFSDGLERPRHSILTGETHFGTLLVEASLPDLFYEESQNGTA